MACRPDKRTQVLEHRRRSSRHPQTLDGVVLLGGLEERGAVDVALFHLRSVEQHLARLRLACLWAWPLRIYRRTRIARDCAENHCCCAAAPGTSYDLSPISMSCLGW